MEQRLQIYKDPIRFYSGDENGVVIEEKDYDKSIFRNQYAQALELFDELANRVVDEKGVAPNNIIAFSGDRGEGKTSCMLTVKHIIESNDTKAFNALTGSIPTKCLDSYEFLEMIEPSFFDQEHNILELVLGQLYHNFKKYEQDDRICGSNTHRKTLGLFNKVKKCATLLISGKSNLYDSIEELDELAASMSLRKYMNELLEGYLKLTGKDMLVITIDDMDYNWQGAYDMTKMLTKYLSGSNCIIMVSVSIKQLAEVVKTSFENDVKHEDSSINFDSIAAKYVNKLIPLHYRVEMPKVLDLSDTPLELYDRINGEEKPINKYDTIKKSVVELIFQKTRFLFYNSELNASLIVPDDLRSLRHLLGLLLSMEDYKKDKGSKEIQRKNLENKRIFQSYFYNTWTQQLCKEDREFVQRLVYNDQSTVNKLVVDYLKRKADERIKDDEYCKSIFSTANYTYNISIGDVFYILDYISRNAIDRESKLLVFFLRSYYSIMMYTYYDLISVDINTLHPEKKDEEREIFKVESWFYNTNSMQRIVNGSYFTYKPSTILWTLEEDNHIGIDMLCITARSLHALLHQIKARMPQYNTLNELDKKIFQENFRMAELFLLSISRRSYEKDNAKVEIDREIPNPFFVESFGEDVRYYVFDIMAPFVNLINVKFTYDRFKGIAGDMYHFARQHNWSLLRKMMEKVSPIAGNDPHSKEQSDYQELRLASDAVIRNAEILSMLKERIESLDHVFINETAKARNIEGFYRLLTKKAEMMTYEKADGYYKKITYKFLDVIAEELHQCDKEKYDNILLSMMKEEQIKSGIEAKNEKLQE